jgi:hypothetical protein
VGMWRQNLHGKVTEDVKNGRGEAKWKKEGEEKEFVGFTIDGSRGTGNFSSGCQNEGMEGGLL